MTIHTLAIAIFVFILSASLTGAIRRLAHKRKLLDIPNMRSSHNRPTPHGGGLALIICFLFLILTAYYSQWVDQQTCLAIALPGIIIGSIGFADDIKRIRLLIRFFVQIACVSLGLFLLPVPSEITIFQTSITISGWNIAIAVFALVWLVNLFNFMDGIDGIAGAEFISVSISAAIILMILGDTKHANTLLLASTPVLGFLVWNWPPAKIFMGDAGSGFLGYILGIGGFYLCAETKLTLWSLAILLGVFIVDASWTLIVRIATKQNWLQPHCNHAYQHLAFKIGSHLYVTRGVLMINAFWLLPMALLAINHPDMAQLIVLIAYSPLMIMCYLHEAGKPMSKTELIRLQKNLQQHNHQHHN